MASATPLDRSAPSRGDQFDADRPRTDDERQDRERPGHGAVAEGRRDRPGSADHRQPVAQAPTQVEDEREALDHRGHTFRAGQAVADDRDQQADEQHADEPGAEDDGGRGDATHIQEHDRDGCQRDDDDGVDDPLDHHRAEHGRAAHPFPFPEGVAAHELAEARGQDVVREVAQVCVAEHPRIG